MTYRPNLTTFALLAFLASTLAGAPARAEAPATTKPAEDVDVALVRAAIAKMLPKANVADAKLTTSIEVLGGRDITVMEILGELGEKLGSPIDDDAVERATKTTPSKTMRGLTVGDLAKLAKGARAAG